MTSTTRSHTMRFGLFTGTTGISWSQLQSLWQHIEATGWDAAFVTEFCLSYVHRFLGTRTLESPTHSA